jgi:hypothetical protein
VSARLVTLQQANVFMWLRHRAAMKRRAQTILQADVPDALSSI